MSVLRAILFDLDGTLVQSRESTWVVFEQVNRKFNLGIDSRDRYYDLFRENLFQALPRALGDAALADRAMAYFLELLRSEYRPLLVPGMIDVVNRLAQTHVLAIISSNAVSVVARIATEAGIQHHIAHIFGGDVIPDKRDAIRTFLNDSSYATLRDGQPSYREEAAAQLRPDEVAFVTDTVGDLMHAKECGVRTVAVTWGLHSEEALAQYRPDLIAHWPLEIVAFASRPTSGQESLLPEPFANELGRRGTASKHK